MFGPAAFRAAADPQTREALAPTCLLAYLDVQED
jgi:hypothetical protein